MLFSPGEKVTVSGQYLNTSTGFEVTLTKGEKFPPTPASNQKYKLSDKTKHKSS